MSLPEGWDRGLPEHVRQGFAESARREREQAEKVNLQRVEYEAFERFWLEDPDAPVEARGGPLDSKPIFPRFCDCARQCGCNTWPVRWRYGWPGPGEYVLAYVWSEAGASTRLVSSDNVELPVEKARQA